MMSEQVIRLILTVLPIFTACVGYLFGYWHRGQRHWRTFNRLTQALKE